MNTRNDRRSLATGVATRAALGLVAALAPAAALACDNIYGIPSDSRVALLWLDPAAPKVVPTVVAESTCSFSGGQRYAAATVSADGAAIAAWHERGLEVHFGGRRRLLELGADWAKRPFGASSVLEWSPDGRRLALGLTEAGGRRIDRLAVLDVRRLGDELPLRVVAGVAPGTTLVGVQWAPDGEALLSIEYRPRDGGMTSIVRRLPLAGGEPSTVVSIEGMLDFFVARTHHGRPGGTRAFEGLAGVGKDLFALRPGDRLERLDLPSEALFAIDWHPSRDQVALLYRRPVTDARGRTWVGVYLVDLARPEEAEQLHDTVDVRTLWFSPSGGHLGWSTPRALFYRPLRAERDAATVRVEAPPRLDDPGAVAEVRGCAWSQDEARLAWCADAKVFVRDLATGADALVADLGGERRAFVGLPQWAGDRLLVTLFEDIDPPARPAPPVDPRQVPPPDRRR